jgi:hypothetical protein
MGQVTVTAHDSTPTGRSPIQRRSLAPTMDRGLHRRTAEAHMRRHGDQGPPLNEPRSISPAESGPPVLSDEAREVIAAIDSRLSMLAADRQGVGACWAALLQSDTEALRLLVEELERLVREGRLRAATARMS